MKARLASHSPPRAHCSQRGSPSAARACGGVSWARRGRVVISSRVAVGSVRRSLGLEPLGLPRRNPVPLRRRAVEAGAERVVEQRLRDMSRKGRGKSRKGKGERVVEERLRDTRDGGDEGRVATCRDGSRAARHPAAARDHAHGAVRVVLSAGALVDRQPIAAELGRAVHLVQRADGAWQLIRVRQARMPLRAPIAVESQPHPQRGGGQPRRRPVRDQTFGKVPGRVREGSVASQCAAPDRQPHE